MALTKCEECGNDVSTKADSCPKCGAKIKPKSIGFGGLILVVIVVGIIGSVLSQRPNSTSTLPAAPSATDIGNQAKEQVPVSNETVSQQNAVKSAKNYLSHTAFSHGGLVQQLEYEKYSHADAVYGADNTNANWKEQAAQSAKNYLSHTAFSHGGLVQQLMYEKFTQEQAEYGANAVGL